MCLHRLQATQWLGVWDGRLLSARAGDVRRGGARVHAADGEREYVFEFLLSDVLGRFGFTIAVPRSGGTNGAFRWFGRAAGAVGLKAGLPNNH